MRTVELTAKLNLCSSCGVCKGICPKECIAWEKENGMFHPTIDRALCMECGLCASVCPGLNVNYGDAPREGTEATAGEVLATYNAWSKNPQLRHVSASGGVVSSIIREMLFRGGYDVAFSLDSYDYSKQLVTHEKHMQDTEEWENTKLPKSRYLPVSHENAISYIKQHRGAKVIFVGTGCATRGICSSIQKLGLDRENYLLIGLFCDKIFNSDVYDYFADEKFCADKQLAELHFKNKESGGWPGNMKFIFSDGSSAYVDKSERMRIKDYFMPERCLYCIDKLNVCADISLGDNYTGQDDSPLGSNSVIIRTQRGLAAWEQSRDAIESRHIGLSDLIQAQAMEWRLNNRFFAQLKMKEIKEQIGENVELCGGVICERVPEGFERAWKANREMLHAGEVYRSDPLELKRQFQKSARKKQRFDVRRKLSKIYHKILG